MYNKILKDINKRVTEELGPRSPIKYLQLFSAEEYLGEAVQELYLYTRGRDKDGPAFAETATAVGRAVRKKLGLKRDSSSAAKTGGFILYSFQEAGVIRVFLGRGKNDHGTYLLEVLDSDSLRRMFSLGVTKHSKKAAQLSPPEDWKSGHHSTGAKLVKTGCKEVVDGIKEDTHSVLLSSINRSQRTGWRVNKKVLPIYKWALDTKSAAFSSIWDLVEPQAKNTKLREAKTIYDIATHLLGSTFYHMYYYDFRFRKYPVTSYLQEQGPDQAKGLLLLAEEIELGEQGYKWLMISLASLW
jgi:hypothetical protein